MMAWFFARRAPKNSNKYDFGQQIHNGVGPLHWLFQCANSIHGHICVKIFHQLLPSQKIGYKWVLSLKSNMNLHFCAVWAVMVVKRTFLQYCKNILVLRQVFNICMGKKMSTFCTYVRNLKVDEHKSEKCDNFSSTSFLQIFRAVKVTSVSKKPGQTTVVIKY